MIGFSKIAWGDAIKKRAIPAESFTPLITHNGAIYLLTSVETWGFVNYADNMGHSESSRH